MSDRKIVKKNQNLIFAKNTWSELESKLVATMLKELNPKKESDFREMTISVNEIEKLWGTSLHITRLDNMCAMLKGKTYSIPNFKENGKVFKYLYISLFRRIEYNLDERTINFKFDNDMKPFILNFTNKFIKYHINNILNFKCKYSISFYEVLKYDKEFKKEKVLTQKFSIEYLNKWLKLPKSYQKYKDLRVQVLTPVCKDLTAHSDIYVKFEAIKKGRKVIAVKFSFMKNYDNKKERKALSQKIYN
jgi:plasmid replication initiation protein